MKKLKGVIGLTLDYELFLKQTGTLYESLILPTEKLLDIALEKGHHYTFFIDVLHLIRLEDNTFPEARDELEMVKRQIHRILEENHRVELHLHPSWRSAKRLGDEWYFQDFSEYALHSLVDDEIQSVIESSANYLNELCREVNPDYSVEAFRAGGWCLQPFEKIRSSLERSGIWIESTVAPGNYRLESPVQYYDFRNTPNKEIYSFSVDPCREDEGGQWLEIPITTIEDGKYYKLLRKISRKFFHTSQSEIMGNGKGMTMDDVYPNGLVRQGKQTKMLTVQNAIWPADYIMIKKHAKQGLTNIIAHPKNFNENTFRTLKTLNNTFLTLKEIANEYKT